MAYSNNTKRYQIFDVKQLAELEDRHKKSCRNAMSKYKAWQASFKNQSDKMAQYYGQKEGLILRAHAVNMISNYWSIRSDFRQAFRDYIAQHCGNPYYVEKAA